MRKLNRIALGVLTLCALVACGSKPEPSVLSDPETEPATELGAAPSVTKPPEQAQPDPVEASREGYRLEDEGEAPVSDDVAFEEDRLPPAPEDVAGESLEAGSVAAETVENLPPVEGEEKIAPSVQTPIEPSVTTPVEGRAATGERGFRVQIGASTDRNGAEELARQARTRTSEAVYVTLESPYYKVRVGDYLDRAAALQLRDRLRANGYPEAWVVTTTVKPSDTGS